LLLLFFHIQHDGEVVCDPEGTVVPDLDAARRQALVAAREMWADAIPQERDLSGHRFVLADQQGSHHLIVPFTDALPEGLRRRLSA